MITLVLDNIRSLHNVGSIIRTADGFGVERLICIGITPYPRIKNDTRLHHIAERADKVIRKTALGAEQSIETLHYESIADASASFDGMVVGLEQIETSIPLYEFSNAGNITLILGNEPNGLSQAAISACEAFIEIPMQGKKESFNVSVAAGIALYALTNQ